MPIDIKSLGQCVTTGSLFHIAATITMGEEGGVANIPGDTGGLTNFGISSTAYPNEDITNMTPARAQFLAQRDYWFPLRADMINCQMIANNLFDFAFHHGVRSVVKKLQFCLVKYFGFTGAIDGLMGNETLTKVNQLIASGQGVAWALHQKLMRMRIEYYVSTAKDNVLKGFINRAALFL